MKVYHGSYTAIENIDFSFCRKKRDFGKGFDCVQMKNDIQAKMYVKTKDMTYLELRAYMDENLNGDDFWRRINPEIIRKSVSETQ